MASFTITSILEKMSHQDKDYRYMAASDLVQELRKDTFKIDADTERRLCAIVLRLLEDVSGDIQGLAVKCLSLMVKKVHDVQIEDMVGKLCAHILEGKEELRGISTIGMKTVIAEIPSTSVGALVMKHLTPRLLGGIQAPLSDSGKGNEEGAKGVASEAKVACLDLLNDLLRRFGSLIIHDHENIMKALLPQLNSPKAILRKRSTTCLGSLAVVVADRFFVLLLDHILTRIRHSKDADSIRTHVSLLGAISRAVGFRVGKHMERVMPMLIGCCDDTSFSEDDEMMGTCLQAFESLIIPNPDEIVPYLPKLVNLCLLFIKHDPNYASEGEDEEDSMETEDEEDESDAGDYSDDDDVSWKVRRAASKCLTAIIQSQPRLLSDIYVEAVPMLVHRLKEREETVKSDIFATFVALLRQTQLVAKRRELASTSFMKIEDETANPLELLRTEVPQIIKAINRQLKEKSLKTRYGAFSLLKELVDVLPGCLSEHVKELVTSTEKTVMDKSANSNLRIEALTFLRVFMATHPPNVFHPHMNTIATPVFVAVKDRYYKIAAEALRLCGEIVKIIRPTSMDQDPFDYRPFIAPLYESTLSRLSAQDQDQEVKECAITTLGLLVSALGDELRTELNTCLPMLLQRLKNEITCLTTVKALAVIAHSPLAIDLSFILGPSLTELSAFLRKSNRPLKQASLNALRALVCGYGAGIDDDLYTTILAEVAALVSDADLHLCHMALSLCTTIARMHAPAAIKVWEIIVPKTLELVRSSLLQGLALQSLLELYAHLIDIGPSELGFNKLLADLLAHKSADLPKQAYHTIAQCVAMLCLHATPSQRDETVTKFIQMLGSPVNQIVALFCLGEIGSRNDLSGHQQLHGAVMAAFQSTSEETKSAASFALGNISVGNMQFYLPLVLSQINTQYNLQYLLLHSLKEIISRLSASAEQVQDLTPFTTEITQLLFSYCESGEEGVRNVVAECLGKLALILPYSIVPQLEAHLGGSPFMRGTVVTALKFTLTEQPQSIDELLFVHMENLLGLLADEDLTVRRAALVMFNCAAHNKPGLVRHMLPTKLPLLYSETVKKPELIREVDLGPFKHTVDDGLELRKAAFECMDTLLGKSLEDLDLPVFISYLVNGLRDHSDIKMLCHLMLSKLAETRGSAMLAMLDTVVEPLRDTVTTRVKENAVKQEVERNDDLIRSALRAIDTITRIPDMESCVKFNDFLVNTVKSGTLAAKYEQVLRERSADHATDMAEERA